MSTTLRSAYRQVHQGINWREFWQAYRVFMPDPAQGILHILAAGEHSRWQKWVMRRLRRQAAAIQDWEVIIDLALIPQVRTENTVFLKNGKI
jgi:hypothetical protein